MSALGTDIFSAPVSSREGKIWGSEPLVRSDAAYRQITLIIIIIIFFMPSVVKVPEG